MLLASEVDSPVDERAVGAATLSLLESAVDSAGGATPARRWCLTCRRARA